MRSWLREPWLWIWETLRWRWSEILRLTLGIWGILIFALVVYNWVT